MAKMGRGKRRVGLPVGNATVYAGQPPKGNKWGAQRHGQSATGGTWGDQLGRCGPFGIPREVIEPEGRRQKDSLRRVLGGGEGRDWLDGLIR